MSILRFMNNTTIHIKH